MQGGMLNVASRLSHICIEPRRDVRHPVREIQRRPAVLDHPGMRESPGIDGVGVIGPSWTESDRPWSPLGSLVLWSISQTTYLSA